MTSSKKKIGAAAHKLDITELDYSLSFIHETTSMPKEWKEEDELN
jgi:hypothetical protein